MPPVAQIPIPHTPFRLVGVCADCEQSFAWGIGIRVTGGRTAGPHVWFVWAVLGRRCRYAVLTLHLAIVANTVDTHDPCMSVCRASGGVRATLPISIRTHELCMSICRASGGVCIICGCPICATSGMVRPEPWPPRPLQGTCKAINAQQMATRMGNIKIN